MIAEMLQGRDLPDALSAAEAVGSRDFEEAWGQKVNAIDLTEMCTLSADMCGREANPYAQVSVLDGVYKKLMQPLDGSFRFWEAIRNIGCEIFRFIQGPKAKTGVHHQAENAPISWD